MAKEITYKCDGCGEKIEDYKARLNRVHVCVRRPESEGAPDLFDVNLVNGEFDLCRNCRSDLDTYLNPKNWPRRAPAMEEGKTRRAIDR